MKRKPCPSNTHSNLCKCSVPHTANQSHIIDINYSNPPQSIRYSSGKKSSFNSWYINLLFIIWFTHKPYEHNHNPSNLICLNIWMELENIFPMDKIYFPFISLLLNSNRNEIIPLSYFLPNANCWIQQIYIYKTHTHTVARTKTVYTKQWFC